MKQALTLNRWIPPNAGNEHLHYMTRHKQVKMIKETVWGAAKHAGWVKVTGRAKLTVRFVFGVNRVRDVDNLQYRAKALVDGLKPFFVDDSPQWLDRVVEVVVERGGKRTEVTLESLDEA